VLLALLFVPAWTLAYWQGWLFLAVWVASTSALPAYLAVNDPALLERRMRSGPQAETTPVQRFVILVVSLGFAARRERARLLGNRHGHAGTSDCRESRDGLSSAQGPSPGKASGHAGSVMLPSSQSVRFEQHAGQGIAGECLAGLNRVAHGCS
jgi:hypothetical protein